MWKCSKLLTLLFLSAASFGEAVSEELDESAFLVMAPDRGFLGNEEVRDVFQELTVDGTFRAGLAFVTRERTEENLQDALDALQQSPRPVRIVVIPMFLSTHDTLFERARDFLQSLPNPPAISAPLGASYLAEEILFDRVEELVSSRPDDETLVVLTAGAESDASAALIHAELDPLVQRAAEKHGLSGARLHVLLDNAPPDDRQAMIDELVLDLQSIAVAGGRPLVVPFSLGMRYTTMMSEWGFLQRSLAKVPEVVSDGKGVLPHANVGLWLTKSVNRHVPLSRDNVGVILVPHGADFNWNETMRRGIAPIRDEYVTEDAFSMVDSMLVERAARMLEARGMRAAIVVRIFFMEASFEDKTKYVLGLENEYRGFPRRVRSSLLFHTVGGIEGSPELAAALGDRLDEVSVDPRNETVILLGHGAGDEATNDRWLGILAELARQMTERSPAPFRAVHYHTWREDWADERRKAVAAIRADVEAASTDRGVAIVVPVRTAGQGPAREYLEGLEYRYATGFAPHPEFASWLRSQIERGMAELIESIGPTE